MLFLVATPIGHLDDFSQRAVQTLQSCDAILCEDTRHSSILLRRYGIKKKLIPYHKFNEKQVLKKILADLEAEKILALISDAGTPGISDPGQILVAACIEKGLAVSAVPGPCSAIQALVMSGFDTRRFQFLGFLPKNPEIALRQAMAYPGTTVAFESPERLVHTLSRIDGKRQIAVVREMTKAFEECRRGKAAELLAHFQAHPPKGEIALVLEGGKGCENLPLEELVQMLQELHGLSLKEAVKHAARLKKIRKRDAYASIHLGLPKKTYKE